MKNQFFIFFFAIVITTFVGCDNSTSREVSQTETETPEITLDSLRVIDRILTQKKEMDPDFGLKAFGTFIKYVRNNPTDTLNPLFLYKAAHIARNVPGKGLKSIQYFTELYENYPEHRLAPEAMFMAGMVWEDVYHDNEKAIIYYRMVIEKYPDHFTAINAKNLIEMRSTSQDDLEWVHQMKQKNENK